MTKFIISQVIYSPSFVANDPTEEPRLVAHPKHAKRYDSYEDAENEITRLLGLTDNGYQIQKIYE